MYDFLAYNFLKYCFVFTLCLIMTPCHTATPELLMRHAHRRTVSFWICSKW